MVLLFPERGPRWLSASSSAIFSLFFICLSFLPLYSSSLAIHRRRIDRWFNPCHGSTPLKSLLSAVDADDLTDVDRLIDETMDRTIAFHALSKRATKLKERVTTLKDKYVRHRFRDHTVIDAMDAMGFRISGMPDVHPITISSIDHLTVTPTVHRTFEHLARVAVFLDQARLGENMADNERTSFEKDFRVIEDHHEDGLYYLLCSIHQIIHDIGVPVDEITLKEISEIRVVEVNTNALRHTRDYMVLRDFEKVLERLRIEFASLAKPLSSS